MKDDRYIECAKIINTHGCHGGLKLESWCNSPEDLARLQRVAVEKNGAYKEFTVLKSSVFKQFVFTELKEITEMDDALALKNEILYARREDFHLAEGEFFIADLIGLPVIDADTQKEYGTVKDRINRGASDLYVVQTADGERMIPAVDEFIVRIDESAVYVRPIAGMLDDAEDT